MQKCASLVRMLISKNAAKNSFSCKIGFDTAENGPSKGYRYTGIRMTGTGTARIGISNTEVLDRCRRRSCDRRRSCAPVDERTRRVVANFWQISAKFRRNFARFRLYRRRSLQENMRFAAFFKIYQILKLKFLKFDKILQILRHLHFFFAEFSQKLLIFQTDFLRKF